MDYLRLALQVVVPVALFASLFAISRLDDEAALGPQIRSRLLMGIPWGTAVTVLTVVSFYLFVERGYWSPGAPLTIPFTSWSYLYPLGLVTGPFAHQSLGHLTGNMIGFVAFGTLAEYAFSHFPAARGSSAFGNWRSNPYVRAFVLFPLGVFLVGLTTSIFSWGPIIGFSGVVLAAAGFALVRFPLATVIALVARNFVGTLYASLRNPIVYGSASPSFGPPWWAGVAIQGHVFGFLVGAVLGVAIITQRKESTWPSATRLWIGTVAVGSSLTLWAIWWYQGPESYLLYRGVGVLFIVVLGLLVAGAVRPSESTVVANLTRREIGIAVLAIPILTMAMVAVPVNAALVGSGTVPGTAITAGGYQITYAEDVQDQRIPAIDLEVLNRSTGVKSSGVIVVNHQRQIWTQKVPKGELETFGGATFTVGGLTWHERIHAKREGWRVAGGETVYRISLRTEDGQWKPVYQTGAAKASPVIASRNVSVEPTARGFFITVSHQNESLERAPIPEANTTVVVGGLNFTRHEDVVTASHAGTRVPIMQKEEYK